ncbi:hypothetical protein GCM10028819_30100 [Spirosoma humi]
MQCGHLAGNVDHYGFIRLAIGFGNGRRTEFKDKNGLSHVGKDTDQGRITALLT